MIKSKLLIILIFSLFLTIQISAQEKPVIAVIPFDATGISNEDAFGLTLFFETALQNIIIFDIVEHMQVDKILEAQEYSLSDFTDQNAGIQIGQLLSANQIIIGTAGKIGEDYYLNIKIIDVQSGINISAEIIYANSILELLEMIDPLAYIITGSEPVNIAEEETKNQYQLTKRTTYDTHGNLMFYSTFTYNSNGNPEQNNNYNADNELLSYIIFEYDSNGNQIKYTEYNPNDTVHAFFAFEYDVNSRIQQGYRYDPGGLPEKYLTYEYDDNNRLIKKNFFNMNGSLFSYYTYIYNSYGNEMMSMYYDAWNKLLNYSNSEYNMFSD